MFCCENLNVGFIQSSFTVYCKLLYIQTHTLTSLFTKSEDELQDKLHHLLSVCTYLSIGIFRAFTITIWSR
jgi:hypothetical protein